MPKKISPGALIELDRIMRARKRKMYRLVVIKDGVKFLKIIK